MKILGLGLLFAMIITASCAQQPGNSTAPNVSAGNTGTNSNIALPSNTVAATASPADELASAREVFKQNCAACHREDGTGGKVEIEGKTLNPENLAKDKFKKATDERLKSYIVNGEPEEGMPAFKGKLSDEEIKQLVAFIRKEIQNK